jgi:hypothetical protein
VLLRIDTPTDHGDFRAGSVRVWPGRASTAGWHRLNPAASRRFGYGRGDALPRGRSWLRVTVLEVDPALAGRAADIELQPPLDLLKLTDLDYIWLWPFFFWKVAALFLLIPGAALAVFTLPCGAGSAGRRRRLQQRIRIDRLALPPLFSGPSTCTSKCRCGASALALPVLPT